MKTSRTSAGMSSKKGGLRRVGGAVEGRADRTGAVTASSGAICFQEPGHREAGWRTPDNGPRMPAGPGCDLVHRGGTTCHVAGQAKTRTCRFPAAGRRQPREHSHPCMKRVERLRVKIHLMICSPARQRALPGDHLSGPRRGSYPRERLDPPAPTPVACPDHPPRSAASRRCCSSSWRPSCPRVGPRTPCRFRARRW